MNRIKDRSNCNRNKYKEVSRVSILPPLKQIGPISWHRTSDIASFQILRFPSDSQSATSNLAKEPISSSFFAKRAYRFPSNFNSNSVEIVGWIIERNAVACGVPPYGIHGAHRIRFGLGLPPSQFRFPCRSHGRWCLPRCQPPDYILLDPPGEFTSLRVLLAPCYCYSSPPPPLLTLHPPLFNDLFP